MGLKRGGAPGFSPLSDAETDQLAQFLGGLGGDALDFEGLDGFFAALIVGPDSVMPSEYLPIVWGGELADEKAFASLEEANAILQLIMRHWNTISGAMDHEGVYVPAIVEAEGEDVPGRGWARGFMKGVALRRASWAELIGDENEAGAILTIALLAGRSSPTGEEAAECEEEGRIGLAGRRGPCADLPLFRGAAAAVGDGGGAAQVGSARGPEGRAE